jgi:hypothetical protein
MIAQTPLVEPAIEAVREFASEHSFMLSSEHVEILLEVARRLERLRTQAADLIQLNNELWLRDDFSVSFDPATDTVVFSTGGSEQRLTLKRADPNVPISMNPLTAGAGYHAGTSAPADEEQGLLRIQLEEKLEGYYHSAHRVLKMMRTVPGLQGIKCEAVTRVRNNLVEHPSEGSFYSFGYGSTGPRVKPMHREKQLWNDEGLVPNTRDFVDAIVSACKSAHPRPG